MKINIKTSFIYLGLLLLPFFKINAQNYLKYTTANAHSHNDYLQKIPFWQAYYSSFGSIEVDIFSVNNQILVAHTENELNPEKTLENLYLNHISKQIKLNKGFIHNNPSNVLRLLIDIKKDESKTLKVLMETLKKYPEIINNPSIQIIITGAKPQPKDFKMYPRYIFFDGNINEIYTSEQLERIGMFSADFSELVKWNGKGILRDEEKEIIKNTVEKAHANQKPIRFYAAPDFPNAWISYINLGIDYINTDHIKDLENFLVKIPKNFFKNTNEHQIYTPNYKTDGIRKLVKNVILLIPDGTSMPQYYAAFTANKGKLNIFNMKYTGLSKTYSSNAYITDSAPGSTAFATGIKTKNNFVGVDENGKPVPQIPKIIIEKGKLSALISTGDITDATVADFYAHSNNRNDSESILNDFINSNVKILIGGKTNGLTPKNLNNIKNANINLYKDLKSLKINENRSIIIDSLASKSITHGRGKWLSEAFDLTINSLKKNKNGFFLMAEASQTDGGGHGNNMKQLVTELLDFDEIVGKAIKFADEDKETLVIVLGDHETGGLSLIDGNLQEGWVLGHFSTNDHTSIPSNVFAYGPNAQDFSGVFENTEVFYKILQAFGMRNKKQ